MGRSGVPAAAAAPRRAGEREAAKALTQAGLTELEIAALYLTGSHAYGLATPTSDRDYRGIYVAPTLELFDLSAPAEQHERAEPDLVVFELAKFARLASQSNPNVLELLWAPVLRESADGALLREHRQAFLSARVRDTYGGYAKGQIQKARNLEEARPEKREKFVRHLFRLFEQGRQLLETGELTLELADPERLREMSRWPLERVEREFVRLDQEFQALPTALPAQPDYATINELVRTIRLRHL